MPVQQACTINEVIAKRLGIEIDLGRWRESVRRHPREVDSFAAFADLVVDMGSQLELVYLRRQLDAAGFERMAAADALPAVVLREAPGARYEAFVVLARAGEALDVLVVEPDRPERPEVMTAGELWRRAAGAGAAVTVLLPVRVSPVVGGAGEGGSPVRSPGRRLWSLLVREKRDIGLVYLYATLVGLFSLALPLGVQAITQLVSGGLILQPVWLLIVFVIVGTLASGILQVMQLSIVELIQQRLFARVALEFAFKVPRIPIEASLSTNVPEAMNRFFEVITIQKSLAKLLTEATTAFLQVSFGMILLTFYHPYFTLFGAALLLGVFVIFRITGPKGLATSLTESKYKYRAVHWLQEMARSITAFKFAGPPALAISRMDEHVTGYLKYRKKHFSVLVQQSVSIVIFKTIVTGALLILGSFLVINRQITLGQFVASEIVIVTVLAGIEKLILSISTVYDILTAVDKAGYVSDLPVEAPGGLDAPHAEAGMAVALRGVSFTYPGSDAPALRELDLAVAPGERVAVIGFDGSGQSTLLRVLAGLVESYQGIISYDGLTLRDLDRTALRSRIGQLLSLTDLFDGTIEENIAVGRTWVDTAEVLRALRLCRVDEKVQQLPVGLRTQLVTGGANLPADMITLLLLAQAIAGRPRLLVMEDIAENLEAATHAEIVRMLTDRAHPWTLVIATHDPAILAACDRVCVMQDGRIVRDGRFADLASDPLLRALLPAAPAAA